MLFRSAVFKLNKLPGKWSQAKVLRTGNSVRFNFVPDEELAKALEARSTPGSKEIGGIKFFGWHQPLTIRVFDIDAIKAERAQEKLDKLFVKPTIPVQVNPSNATVVQQGGTSTTHKAKGPAPKKAKKYLDKGKLTANRKRRRTFSDSTSTASDLEHVVADFDHVSMSDNDSDEEMKAIEKATPIDPKALTDGLTTDEDGEIRLKDVIPEDFFYLLEPFDKPDDDTATMAKKARERERRTVLTREEALELERVYYAYPEDVHKVPVATRLAFEDILQQTLGRPLSPNGDPVE